MLTYDNNVVQNKPKPAATSSAIVRHNDRICLGWKTVKSTLELPLLDSGGKAILPIDLIAVNVIDIIKSVCTNL